VDIRKSSKRLAKLLTYVLGRQPDEFGLVLDDNGYVRVKELLKAVCEEDGWKHVRRRHLEEILITLPNPPVTMEQGHIRAVDGSHLPRPEAATDPPKQLYHCVRRRAYPHVREKGIRPPKEEPVCLAADQEMALRIGRRKDAEPVLVTVHVSRAGHHGITFQRYGSGLYLSGSIPADCLTGPSLPKPKTKDEKPAPEPPPPPGRFFLEPDPQKRAEKRFRRKKEIAWKKERRKRSRR